MSKKVSSKPLTAIDRPWGDAWGNAWSKPDASVKANSHNPKEQWMVESQREQPWNAIGAVGSEDSRTCRREGKPTPISDGDRATKGTSGGGK